MARKLPITGKSRHTNLKPDKARKLIRRFHVLLKSQQNAAKSGKKSEQTKIKEEIEKLGGLEMYQRASICGQSSQRGGDSSKLLVEWLGSQKYNKLLEIGCLQVDNFCAKSRIFSSHKRIDLNSQHPLIEAMDFMDMPYEQFDVISLSLVLNYVATPQARGEMLKKCHKCLVEDGLLFFVLPKACTDNSRYCDDRQMDLIFRSVGFKPIQSRKTDKLVYYLLKKIVGSNEKVRKQQVNEHKKLNNFCVTIE